MRTLVDAVLVAIWVVSIGAATVSLRVIYEIKTKEGRYFGE